MWTKRLPISRFNISFTKESQAIRLAFSFLVGAMVPAFVGCADGVGAAGLTDVSSPRLRLSPVSLDFGTASANLTFEVFNDGGEPLDWSAQTGVSWLSLSPSSGRVPAGSSVEIKATASRSALSVGGHETTVQLSSNGGNASVVAKVHVATTDDSDSGGLNVRDFGAVGDGVTNDVAAFAAALSALRVSGGGVLTVPAGVYLLEPATNGALTLGRNQANITIAGGGIDRTILRMAPISYRGATHVILIEKASGISVRDLTLDGNEPSASYNGELQSHGIEIRSTSDVHVERVRFTRLHGDGIRLVGRYQGDEPWTERVLIQDSHFQDCGRSGIGMQRAVRDVRILNNTFEGVNHQSLSSEPTFGGLVDVGIRDIVMEGNVIRHSTKPWAVALEGVSPTDVARRIVFRNNRVENGSVTFRMADDVLIEGNTLVSSLNRPALELPTNVTNIQIIDNDIGGAGGVQGYGVLQVAARYDNQTFPSRITIRNNRIRPRDGTSGILVRDALGEVTIVENEVYGSGNATGIDISNPYVKQLPRSGYTIESNTVNNFEWGVRFSTAGDPFEEVLIRRNSVDHEQSSPTETVGLIFNKTGAYEAFATVAENLFGAGIKKDIVVR